MPDLIFANLRGSNRGNWIRLRTMILLRWIAISGQIGAMVVAIQLYNLQLELGLCLLTIGTSIVFNLVATFIYPENKRLSEGENLFMVLFDLLQLSVLLFLTGGLNNPFALLLLAPVTVSATVLHLRDTVLLGGVSVVIVTLLTTFFLPLRTEQGFILRIPEVFIFGEWIAIVIGILFLSTYTRRVSSEMHAMSDALAATQMALAREQKLTDLGGVVAAAAHELGTPLATIKLASGELIEELADHPELSADARLISEQADRCRDILQSMGRAGKDDLHMRSAPLAEVVQEAAEPHQERGKTILFEALTDSGLNEQPEIYRRPEIIHGIRNLVQNAVDFARSTVWIEIDWNDDRITLRIVDDGDGYPGHLIGRIGDPFVGSRRSRNRPDYEGMGLGLFIAKTLLERTGAEITFANGNDPFIDAATEGERTGAIVEVSWPRGSVDATHPGARPALGENEPIRQ